MDDPFSHKSCSVLRLLLLTSLSAVDKLTVTGELAFPNHHQNNLMGMLSSVVSLIFLSFGEVGSQFLVLSQENRLDVNIFFSFIKHMGVD